MNYDNHRKDVEKESEQGISLYSNIVCFDSKGRLSFHSNGFPYIVRGLFL